jgi:hypothetical protein
MCAGDDKTCPEFEPHHRKFKETLDRERRSFLKSSFAAAGGAAALTAGDRSRVTPEMGAAAELHQPAKRAYHHLPANADTVHWGFISTTGSCKSLQVEFRPKTGEIPSTFQRPFLKWECGSSKSSQGDAGVLSAADSDQPGTQRLSEGTCPASPTLSLHSAPPTLAALHPRVTRIHSAPSSNLTEARILAAC